MTSPAQPHVAMDDVINPFDDVDRGPYTVTADDLTRLVFLRGACLIAAWHRATLLYGEVAPLVGLATRGMGRILDLLSYDCIQRKEPSLAALVVRADTGQAGAGFVGDDAAEREACYRHWREQRGRRSH